eukprot:3729259-Amphidinium_carterae.2
MPKSRRSDPQLDQPFSFGRWLAATVSLTSFSLLASVVSTKEFASPLQRQFGGRTWCSCCKGGRSVLVRRSVSGSLQSNL